MKTKRDGCPGEDDNLSFGKSKMESNVADR